MGDEELSDEIRLIAGKPMYFDRGGKPIGLRTWSKAFEDGPGRTVARDVVREGTSVLTMWMGHDISDNVIEPDVPPLIFGTLVRLDGQELVEFATATEADAVTVHRLLLEAVRGGVTSRQELEAVLADVPGEVQ